MKKASLIKVLSLTVFCLLGISQMGFAWQGVDANGISISTAAGSQFSPQPISDGQGGSIIAWEDTRYGNTDIYVQAIDSTGSVKWTTNGVAICTAAGSQQSPQLVSDGQGGAIITWQDLRNGSNYDIYAQTINSTGSVKWTANGIAICSVTDEQITPQLVSDGQGGAIITWQDYRNGNTNLDIYAQAINNTGSVYWTLNGIAICTTASTQNNQKIVSDGQGGAIITWQDLRNGVNEDIYAQAIDSTGTVNWTLDGVAICTAVAPQYSPQIVSDGQGGAIMTWHDYRNGADSDIYAQTIDSTGSVSWTSNGVAICTVVTNQQEPQLISNGQGGAIMTWHDSRNGSDEDIYAQAIDSIGTVNWTLDGVAICTATGNQQAQQLVSDGQGGAIIIWHDTRIGAYYDIYAQAIDSTGTVTWTINGVAICTATDDQIHPQLVSNGQGGAIMIWQDLRNGSNYNIYAQSINQAGRVPVELFEFNAE